MFRSSEGRGTGRHVMSAGCPRRIHLPVAEFGFPGPLRERLVAAILAGKKTATSSLLIECEREGSVLPRVGDREVVVDTEDRAVAVIETTRVEQRRFDQVDVAVAVAEGEGYQSVDDWREAHWEFWTSSEFREAIGEPELEPGDDTPVVITWFRVVEYL